MMTMKRKKYTLRRFADDAFTYTTLIIVSLIFVFPCLWLVLASFSKSGSLYDMRGFFPAEYSAQTFVDLFTDDVNGLYPYKKWFMNTLYVSSMSCIFGTILVILTGYVMSKFNFKGRNGVKKLTLVLGMFPGFMGMTAKAAFPGIPGRNDAAVFQPEAERRNDGHLALGSHRQIDLGRLAFGQVDAGLHRHHIARHERLFVALAHVRLFVDVHAHAMTQAVSHHAGEPAVGDDLFGQRLRFRTGDTGLEHGLHGLIGFPHHIVNMLHGCRRLA